MRMISIKNNSISLNFLLLSSFVFYPSYLLKAKQLPEPLAFMLEQENIPPETLSIIIQKVDSSAPLIDFNSKKYRSPGSLTKLFTSFVALDYLGPETQWHTKIFASDSIDDGTVDQLLIVGGGDPFLTTDKLLELIHKLRKMGIHTIENGLLIDQRVFPKGNIKSGDFDNDPLRPYNVMHASLMANFNTIDFVVKKNAKKNKIDIEYDFLPDGIYFDNKLKIGNGSCADFREQVNFNQLIQESYPPRVIIELSGEYPQQCNQYTHDIAVTETNHFFFGLFSYLWKKSGGSISGYINEANIDKSDDLLLNFKSIKLLDLLPHLLKDSNNFIARQLFFSIGQSKSNYNLKQSRKVIKKTLKKNKINSRRNFYDNGSGLSRSTKIRPDTLSSLLQVIYQHSMSDLIISSLPISGVDGTLSNRFNSTQLKGRMRLKTGTLDGVRSLAGFVQGMSGQEYIVVLIHNDLSEHSYKTKGFENALFEWLIDDLERVL